MFLVVHILDMSSYLWDIFAKAWHFTLPSFGLDQLLRIPKFHIISFGFWMRVTSEGTNNQVTSAAMVCIRPRVRRSARQTFMNAKCLNSERLHSDILHLADRMKFVCFIYIQVPMVIS